MSHHKAPHGLWEFAKRHEHLFTDEEIPEPNSLYENGKYKYIDFSHGFFYDTMIQPVQTTVAQVQRDPNAPLVPQLLDGMVKATGKVFEPFIQESIWIGTVLDIFARKGRTKEGRQIWNERDEPGDKLSAAIEYAAKELSPGSREQLVRLYKALTDQTVKGTKLSLIHI